MSEIKNNEDFLSKEELEVLLEQKDLTPEEVTKVRGILQVTESGNRNKLIPDGKELLAQLREEAKRQKAIKSCEVLKEQVMPTEATAFSESSQAESALADTFEVFEED